MNARKLSLIKRLIWVQNQKTSLKNCSTNRFIKRLTHYCLFNNKTRDFVFFDWIEPEYPPNVKTKQLFNIV